MIIKLTKILSKTIALCKQERPLFNDTCGRHEMKSLSGKTWFCIFAIGDWGLGIWILYLGINTSWKRRLKFFSYLEIKDWV